jgi:hypothetical protein
VDFADDLVTGDAGIEGAMGVDGAVPVTVDGVDVGVTDAAEEDVDAKVVGAEVAATEGVGSKRRRVGVGRVSMSCVQSKNSLQIKLRRVG